MSNYQHMAMDEVYDILLYNPDNVDDELKRNLILNLMEYYQTLEEYEKCGKLQEVMKVMEKDNEDNNKKNWW
jgi:hypothetical protein